MNLAHGALLALREGAVLDAEAGARVSQGTLHIRAGGVLPAQQHQGDASALKFLVRQS